jgi:hypothetical protein
MGFWSEKRSHLASARSKKKVAAMTAITVSQKCGVRARARKVLLTSKALVKVENSR